MTPEEARENLAVIRDVVDRSREERNRGGDIYVAWGVVLVLCTALTLGGNAVDVNWGWVSYPILGTLTAVWTGWTARSRGLSRVTYGTRIEGTLWSATGAALFAVLTGGLASGALPLGAVIPMVLAVVGVAQTTSGTIYKSRVLGWSGIGFLVLSPFCFAFDWQTQYALFGVAMVLGYVVPGVILMREERTAG